MGSLDSTNLAEPSSAPRASLPPRSAPKSHWLLWTVILAVVVVALALWYFRSSSANSEGRTQGQAEARPAARGQNPGRGGTFAVPVVVATAYAGNLPVYFNGLGTVTAFNTVTVRSRVDGQIIKINFQEGQYVHQGDSLAEIDPRPFQVQLEQAEGQLAKDQAQLNDARANLARYQALWEAKVIAKQQLDTQAASVGQFEGAIKADQSAIDNAKLQLTYAH